MRIRPPLIESGLENQQTIGVDAFVGSVRAAAQRAQVEIGGRLALNPNWKMQEQYAHRQNTTLTVSLQSQHAERNSCAPNTCSFSHLLFDDRRGVDRLGRQLVDVQRHPGCGSSTRRWAFRGIKCNMPVGSAQERAFFSAMSETRHYVSALGFRGRLSAHSQRSMSDRARQRSIRHRAGHPKVRTSTNGSASP